MDSQEVEILAIGAGPANLALAVALEELAPDLASSTLIVEQHETVLWQRGMLLPWSQSQVSFLKDLVTLRNPRSQYSFISYLHSVGRLNEFINMGSFTPYRLEISDYLQWVAAGLSMVRVQSGKRCLSIEPEINADGVVSEWLVRMSDGAEIRARNLVFGGGRDPHIPSVFDKLPPSRRIHSTQYSEQITGLDPDGAHRIAVIGGAQSAAEMVWASHQQFSKAEVTMVMRSIGLNCYESSRFTNELFFPSFVDEFHDALPEAREQLLREMHRTNYSGLAPSLLEVLYRQMYLERLTGNERMRMRTMVEIADAELVDGEVLLTLLDRKTGQPEQLACDVVLLGTGFSRQMPRMVRELAASVLLEEIAVTRNYRLQLPPTVQAGCYLQGVNEATHGMSDTLLSVLSVRSGEIVNDLLSHQREPQLMAKVPVPVPN